MDSLTLIQARLAGELSEMNRIIRDSLATSNSLMNKVVDNYLRVKGKQIRPLMVLLSAKMFGEVNHDVLLSGAALEMLHNATLIHDDVVDETALRRGRATVNHRWGNQVAVLVGDYFVSNALAASISTGNIAIISALSDLGKELSLGEVDQINNAREHLFDEQKYMEMIGKKTASLFMNCVKMGAEAAGASPDQYSSLMEYAYYLGLCFQIRDDIFDYVADDRIGKPTGNDLREGKVTLPLLYALKKCDSEERREALELLNRGDLNQSEIDCLVDFARSYGGIRYAEKVMKELRDKAFPLLDRYPEGEWKDSFKELFDYVIIRDV